MRGFPRFARTGGGMARSGGRKAAPRAVIGASFASMRLICLNNGAAAGRLLNLSDGAGTVQSDVPQDNGVTRRPGSRKRSDVKGH
jgi:hypothetical protein